MNIPQRYITDKAELQKIVQSMKNLGMKVVLTQGVYDLIHEGHALYLEKAKALGDVLIVAVDSDELTRMRKGPKRPIVPQNERVNMLLHLRHVDIVTIKEASEGLGDVINNIRPDVMVFSGSTKDVSQEHINEYKDCCGEIVVLPAQATTTTTARIRNLTIEGAEKLAKEVNELIAKFLQQIGE